MTHMYQDILTSGIIRGMSWDTLCALITVITKTPLHSVSDRYCCYCFVNRVMVTDRRSQAVAEFVGEGQLDVSRRQELSVVLDCDQTCVQGGGLAVTQGGLL